MRLQRSATGTRTGEPAGHRPVADGRKAHLRAGYGRVAVGDVSFEHGGDIPGHDTHEQGLDVDVRLMRDGRNQCA